MTREMPDQDEVMGLAEAILELTQTIVEEAHADDLNENGMGTLAITSLLLSAVALAGGFGADRNQLTKAFSNMCDQHLTDDNNRSVH